MEQSIYLERIRKWQGLINEMNTCGMSKNEWCKMQGITRYKLYYWRRRVRDFEMTGESDDASLYNVSPVYRDESNTGFVALALPDQQVQSGMEKHPVKNSGQHAPFIPEAIIELKDTRIMVNGSIQQDTMRIIMEAVRNA